MYQKKRFKLQAVFFSETEYADPELDGDHPVFLRMRHWDDMAKDLNFKYQYDIDFIEEALCKLLLKRDY